MPTAGGGGDGPCSHPAPLPAVSLLCLPRVLAPPGWGQDLLGAEPPCPAEPPARPRWSRGEARELFRSPRGFTGRDPIKGWKVSGEGDDGPTWDEL